MSSTTHRLQLLVAAVLFSTGGAVIKATTLTAWQVTCFRSALAALFLIAVTPDWRRGLSPAVLLVGLAYGTTLALYVGGNKLTTAANTIFLQSSAPIYLLFLGPWLLKERTGRADVAHAAVIGAGLLLFFVGVDPPVATAPRPLLGNALGAMAGVTWALTILGLRWLGRGANPHSAGSAIVVGNLIPACALLPVALPVVGAGTTDALAIVYLGVVQIGLAYLLVTRGVRGLPALEVSLLLLIEPVLNPIWAFLLHDERPGPWAAAGCGVILIATLLRTLRRR